MLLPFPFTPVFQYNEISGRVTLFSSAHDGKSGDSNIILHFRIRIQNSVNLVAYRLCTFQTGCGRKLDNRNKIPVIFIRNECRRPVHKEQHGNSRQYAIRHKSHSGTCQQPFDYLIIRSLRLIISLVESFVYEEVRRLALFQKQRTESRCQCQGVETAQYGRSCNSQRKLFV